MVTDANWPEVKLESVAEEITVGYVGPMRDQYRNAGIPFLRSLNIKPSRIERGELKFISPEFHKRIHKSHLRPGDVVIVRTGDPGTAAVIPDSFTDANCADLVVVRPSTKLNSHFLAYYINAVAHHQVSAHIVGAVQQHFNVGSAKQLLLRLPKRHEQDEIAGTLRQFDRKIESNRRMNRTLEELAAALFRAWFVEFEPVAAKAAGRAPAHLRAGLAALFPSAFQDSPLGPIPLGWRAGALSDLVSVNARKRLRDYPHKEIEYLDISSVSEGTISATSRMALAVAPSRAQRLVTHGDTIWSCVRPNRRSFVLIQNPPINMVVSTGFAVLTPTCGSPAFVYTSTTADEFTDYLTAHAEGSAYPAVKPETFEAAPIVIPPSIILTEFEKIVRPWLTVASHNVRESRTLAALRDALLPKLLSGEVRVRGDAGRREGET